MTGDDDPEGFARMAELATEERRVRRIDSLMCRLGKALKDLYKRRSSKMARDRPRND